MSNTSRCFAVSILASACLLLSSAVHAQGDCIRTREINGFDPLDRSNLILWGIRKRPYHVRLSGSCSNLEFNARIASYDRDRDGRLCPGFDSILAGQPAQRCPIRDIKPLTDSEAIKLLEQYGRPTPPHLKPDEPEITYPDEESEEKSESSD